MNEQEPLEKVIRLRLAKPQVEFSESGYAEVCP
jgi:hypothetical protein